VSRSRSGADRLTTRPSGLAPGVLGLGLAWAGGLAIARLTGATPVVIVLAAALVWFAGAFVAGYLVLRRASVGDVVVPPIATAGAEFPIRVDVRSTRPVWVEVRRDRHVIASGWSSGNCLEATATTERRAALDALTVRVRTAGVSGIAWWRRDFAAAVGELIVAPRAVSGRIEAQRPAAHLGGELAGTPGAIAGEIDGVRPWREGDGDKAVHWASTLRSGELVVHDHRHDAERRMIVRARTATGDPDAEAGRARWALEQGLRSGADVVAAIDDGEPTSIPDTAAAARWTALADLGLPATSDTKRPPRQPVEPETTARASARWWAAGATFIALVTLHGALGYGPLVTVLVAGVVTIAAAVSSRSLVTGTPVPAAVRLVVGLGALGSFLVVAAGIQPFTGLLSMLRGPLPQVLVILVLLHGFECRDRRTVRVGLGISGVVLVYAAGFRVDDAIGWWLLAWMVCFAMSTTRLALPTARQARAPRSAQAFLPRVGAVALGAALTIGMLTVVPIPEGPARLTLPTFIENAQDVAVPGAIAAPDGSIRDGTDTGGGSRAPAGQAGGYTGFAQSMDTSVRGPMSDEIVMRVRAPEPDFWRGQTFATFDGRRWYADDDVGVRRGGPNIDIPRALGDTAEGRFVQVDRFVQTFYVEADMPNVIFAAYRPIQAIVDADVWTRNDGAIRASTVLTEGSIYTVVSARPRVTEEQLRGDGLIGKRLSRLGEQVLARYLVVPESTTPETIALADRLAAGRQSTYDVVLAYEDWMAHNVQYDIDAPVPKPGEDAVHDFLFDSKRGFCEQIASALAIMLRTQGVPTRVATGYAAGTRDRIAGVYEVRATDAHAWVEVWFPTTGWQAFDPTASVPLSGEVAQTSVGEDLAAGLTGYVGDHGRQLGLVVVVAIAAFGLVALALELWRRHRRGRWGLLQDRFGALATRRGAPGGATNLRRAESWGADDDSEVAKLVAQQLDRVAFDPTFDDDDTDYDETRRQLSRLARR
jgi:transglutaminase-like putative cysteine protease